MNSFYDLTQINNKAIKGLVYDLILQNNYKKLEQFILNDSSHLLTNFKKSKTNY